MAEVVGGMRWYLEIDGIVEGQFREVTGLGSETEVIENRIATKGGNQVIQKIPGALKFNNIVLRRGLTDDTKLHDWRQLIEDGKVESNRKNGSLKLYNADGATAVVQYDFTNAWPCKIKGPAVDSTKNEVAIEEMELCVETLKRVAV